MTKYDRKTPFASASSAQHQERSWGPRESVQGDVTSLRAEIIKPSLG